MSTLTSHLRSRENNITMSDKVAFIIGNGGSREGFDLESLRSKGTIYGCNALYREFEPDWLVSIDEGIINEIRTSTFPQNKFHVPPQDEQYEPAEVNPGRPRSNAGMNAMELAIRHGYKKLFMIGFDFLIEDKAASVSNIFDGTNNYGPSTRANYADNGGRTRYLSWFMNKYSDVEFFFAYPREKNWTFRQLPNQNVRGTYLDCI